METIQETLQAQQEFFASHVTKNVEFRIMMLRALKKGVLEYEERLNEALWKDLHKSKFEAYETEIGLVLEELSTHIRKLRGWAKPQSVRTPIAHFISRSYRYPEPYGTVLIMAPWNYPILLLLTPLIGAISAGNTVVLKPAENSLHTSAVLAEMISEIFEPQYISIFTGGKDLNQALLAERYDYIFFTGSPVLGKIVQKAAAEHLTPTTLELGGKSPCIVCADADIDLAAKRVAWGKFINAGQTCVAPDYLFLHSSIKEKFITSFSKWLKKYYGENPKESADYPRIINEQAYNRLSAYLTNGNVVLGGQSDPAERYIAPTLLEGIAPDSPVMQDEIFGPIAPIFPFEEISEVVEFINSRPKPLALYIFSTSKKTQKQILLETSSGGVTINDVLVHLANSYMPFGGVGQSGTGGYHGRFSFDTFSHYKSVLNKWNIIDMPVRYAPAGDKLKLLKMIIR